MKQYALKKLVHTNMDLINVAYIRIYSQICKYKAFGKRTKFSVTVETQLSKE